ncbi:hypothetical protein K461DRAFT_321398 [Myriangium duriaei CBS 260.36]|uniref:Uncharacterized protein n=1 Tax=Myriangium duriaei CBS 260.36 TaxID=1168546 RepID=A0A9P4J0G9_9PEZI|nr:hypothetical protein K461DRAFT_321398 [Myriangium duriaei CBS 260.36]
MAPRDRSVTDHPDEPVSVPSDPSPRPPGSNRTNPSDDGHQARCTPEPSYLDSADSNSLAMKSSPRLDFVHRTSLPASEQDLKMDFLCTAAERRMVPRSPVIQSEPKPKKHNPRNANEQQRTTMWMAVVGNWSTMCRGNIPQRFNGTILDENKDIARTLELLASIMRCYEGRFFLCEDMARELQLVFKEWKRMSVLGHLRDLRDNMENFYGKVDPIILGKGRGKS